MSRAPFRQDSRGEAATHKIDIDPRVSRASFVEGSPRGGGYTRKPLSIRTFPAPIFARTPAEKRRRARQNGAQRPAFVWEVAKTLAESKGTSGNNPSVFLRLVATMSGVTVFSRTDSALLRVVAAAGNAEAEAEKMSYGHPFRVEVAAQVANVQKGALDAALARGAVGADWFEASLADVFAALARTTRGEKRPREMSEPSTTAPPRSGESEAATRSGESEAATQEDASREALGEWQAWLVPCCHATAPKAKEVKAILRSRGAPPWLYGICREVSQKSAAGTYRKILQIGRQAVAAAV